MKKSAPWSEDIEKAIDKARSDAEAKAFIKYAKTLNKLYTLASEIMSLTAGFQPPKDADFREVGEPAPAPKRKAVTAKANHIEYAYDVLSHTRPPYSELTAKNVAAVWHGEANAYRLAGAALKALVADGRAVVKHGKYAQAEPTAEASNNADRLDHQPD
jgi:hypothetical protein